MTAASRVMRDLLRRVGVAAISAFAALALVALALIVSCTDFEADRRAISSTVLAVGPDTVTVRPSPALRGIGPVSELCLTMPGDYEYRGEIGADSTWKLRRPDGPVVALSATLVAPDGTREAFDHSRLSVGSERHPDHVLCFEKQAERDPGRRYDRIELQSADSVLVLGIRWDSGKRFASL